MDSEEHCQCCGRTSNQCDSTNVPYHGTHLKDCSCEHFKISIIIYFAEFTKKKSAHSHSLLCVPNSCMCAVTADRVHT